MVSLELQDRIAIPPIEPPLSQFNDAENAHNVVGIEQNLAPADKGVAAWRLLGVAFVFEALLWGEYFHPNFAR
jgi:hypothetical protein